MKKILIAATVTLLLHMPAHAGLAEGMSAYKARNYAQALKELTPLAKAGNPDAQNVLGLMYYTGQGVTQDYRKAAPLFTSAGTAGKADAQYVLGAMYYTGKGVPQDYRSAVVWFRKAAEQGHGDAQHLLGLMYLHQAAGLPKDPVLAYMMWNLAASNGSAAAVEMRANAVKRMSAEQVEEGQALSAGWKVGTPLPMRSRSGSGDS